MSRLKLMALYSLALTLATGTALLVGLFVVPLY